MKDKLADIWVVFVPAVILWLSSFWYQKTSNAANAVDYSAKGLPVLSRLLGLHPKKERIYLRPASIQVIGLLYLAIGLFMILIYDRNILLLLWYGLGIGLIVVGLFWFLVDVLSRIRR